MKRLTSLLTICLAGAGIAAIISGCDKTKPYDTLMAEAQVHFVGSKFQNYQMAVNPAPVFKVNLGTTDVSSSARTVTVNVSSSSGAVAGTHYSLPGGNIVTIPAGQATAALDLQGVYNQYTSGRKDTLRFTLAQPDIAPAKFTDTIYVILRGPCFEGDVTLNAFAGNWTAIETLGGGSPYGPYPCTIPIASITQLTPTTGTVTVTNIWDNGWGPITFTLDWTDPVNRTATVIAQNAIAGSNAGDLNSAYAGQTVAVRPFAGSPGTFSACNNTFTLRMQLGVTNVGYFAALYTVNLTR
ncbi:MAG TPA: hypothetical protein VIZ28_05315 [Chitinophagaceae bacterium]